MKDATEQVRYGRFKSGRKKGQRRSALVTVRSGDMLFFGISKCHKYLDDWGKHKGTHLARKRATELLKASLKKDFDDWNEVNGVKVHENGLLGFCHISQVKNLLWYFEEASSYLNPNKTKNQTKVS